MVQPVKGSIAVTGREASWTHNLDAFLIQLGTRSRYNHAAIVSAVDGDDIYVIEAAGKGVRERKLNTDEIYRWKFEADPRISEEQRNTMVAEARKYLGWPYDYKDILLFIKRFWTGKALGRTEDYADDAVICSELVAWVMFVAGIDPWPTIAFGAISPGDIAEWMFGLSSARGVSAKVR